MGSLKLPNMIDITARVDEWSTDSPTEDGWYWVYDGEDMGIKDCTLKHGEVVVWFGIQFRPVSEYSHWHFLGPLPKPEPPESA